MARAQLSPETVNAMRQKLLALALAIYRAEGLDAISFRRLAEAAGISHTLPYRYFDSKEALLVALRVLCTQRFEAHVRACEAVTAPPAFRIRSVAEAYVSFVEKHAAEYQLIFSTHQPPPDQYPELLAARRSLFDHAALLLAILSLGLGACSRPPEVTVSTGTLRGVATDGVMAFKGIPFAAPPVGEWRWRPPQPPAPWGVPPPTE